MQSINTILKDKDPWMLGEEIPDMDFQFSEIWLTSFANDLERTAVINFKKILCIYHGYNLKFYYGEKDSDNFAKHLLLMLQKNPSFRRMLNNNIRKHSNRLKQISTKITLEFLTKLSNREFAQFYQQLDEVHTELYTWGWLPNAIDMFHGNFTSYLKNILTQIVALDEVNPILVTLSVFPEKSVINLEHESFLKLVALKQRKVSREKLSVAINKHLDSFFYLKHLWLGLYGVYTYDYYVKEIQKFNKTGKNAKQILQKEDAGFLKTLKERQKLFRTLGLTKNQKALFDVYAEFAVTKVYRRDAQLHWAYKMDFVFKELSKRLDITFMQSRFMWKGEVIEGLRQGKLPASLKRQIKERTKFCATVMTKGAYEIFYGKKAKALEKSAESTVGEGITEITGQTACLGKVIGKVKVINSVSEMNKMQKGDILVSIATNPDIVPAMKKAGAIVTEQGGITSHAAIVSRELGVPCVIGTKIATKVLKDGDMVEVDANKGIVKKL